MPPRRRWAYDEAPLPSKWGFVFPLTSTLERQEIKEQQVLEAGKFTGLVDVKVVSFSATHAVLRPKAKR